MAFPTVLILRWEQQVTEELIPDGQWGAGLTPSELAEMQAEPSLFVNRIYARPYGRMIRVSLGENVEGKTNWHSAIAVSADDLVSIAEVLLTQAKFALNPPVNPFVAPPTEQGDAQKE